MYEIGKVNFMDNPTEIEAIASKVLGKTADGKTMMRYETPDEVDASQLVGIPRHLNRTDYGITDDTFVGVDTWNGYEFSCLLSNGYPLSGWVRWTYASDTPNIVESKSAKLYLNSYNMADMGPTIDVAMQSSLTQIKRDMEAVIGGKVDVAIFTEEVKGYQPAMRGSWLQLEELVDVANVSFDQYNENPNTLKVIDNPQGNAFRIKSNSLRSNCRVTNQPDWGDIYIHIKGNKVVTTDSLLQYIVSMRKENHFHEEICECVYKRLSDLLSPDELMVSCLYTRRGGIDINPIRSNVRGLWIQQPIAHADSMTTKTMRQ
jgi:7-cyano-7-deazaguanine reductase